MWYVNFGVDLFCCILSEVGFVSVDVVTLQD